MAKEFVFATENTIQVATKARVAGVYLDNINGFFVEVAYLSGSTQVASKSVSITKAQADNFFNNFDAEGGGIVAFNAKVLQGLYAMGEIPSGSLRDI